MLVVERPIQLKGAHMTIEQIKALTDLELLTKFELYEELQSTSVRDDTVRELLARELDNRGL
jgi:hypothetical protein